VAIVPLSLVPGSQTRYCYTMPKKNAVTVRQATRADIPTLVKLNQEAYPQLANENVVWKEAHLLAHQRAFPQGQLLATSAGKIVGAASTLIVDMGPDPLRPHTWSGVTDGGYFSNHDPRGDTLYGADIYVHPKSRLLGVGGAQKQGCEADPGRARRPSNPRRTSARRQTSTRRARPDGSQ
jgi:hypothetical protein